MNINALVVERIYGWVSVDAPTWWGCKSAGVLGAAWRHPDGQITCKACQGTREFDTDVSAALDALEKVVGTSSNWYVHCATYKTPFEYWCSLEDEEWSTSDVSLPLAISRCALRVAGVLNV